jgi:hypothetical protein
MVRYNPPVPLSWNETRHRALAPPNPAGSFIHQIAPHGLAGFVLTIGSDGSGSSNKSGEAPYGGMN